jgi:hypothetical protein
MARPKSDLTPTQQDDAQFAQICAQIRPIGPRRLAEHAGVSHETINNYLRREPITEATEDKILEGLRAYKAEKARLAEERRQMVDEVLSA